jgi:hypothetical protein
LFNTNEINFICHEDIHHAFAVKDEFPKYVCIQFGGRIAASSLVAEVSGR